MKYEYDLTPTEPGWYVAVKCWDASEGFIPVVCKWDAADGYDTEGPVIGFAGPFQTESDAGAWLEANDPEGNDLPRISPDSTSVTTTGEER